MHHHVAAAVERLHRTDRRKQFLHASLGGIGLVEGGVGSAAEGPECHPVPLEQEDNDLVERGVEVAVQVVDARRIFREDEFEAVGHGWGRVANQPENLRGVQTEVAVDEGGMVRLDRHTAGSREPASPVGRYVLEQPLRVAERELERIGDHVSERAVHGGPPGKGSGYRVRGEAGDHLW